MQHFGEWPVYQKMDTGYFDLALVILPLFWFISLAVFIIFVYLNIKKTDKGYRYRPSYILVISLCLSIVLGFIFHLVGTGMMIDDFLSERAPYYDRLVNPHLRYWSDPEHGRLIGMVSSEVIDNSFFLVSSDRGEWRVYLESNQNQPPFVVTPGTPVRCLGKKIAEQQFLASQVTPVIPGRKFFNRPGTGCNRVQLEVMKMPTTACGQKLNKTKETGSLASQELRNIISQNLITNKDKVRALILQDPNVLKDLMILRLDPVMMQKILEQERRKLFYWRIKL